MAEGFRVHGLINAGDAAAEYPKVDRLSDSVCYDHAEVDGVGVWKIEFIALGNSYHVGLLAVLGTDPQSAVDRWKWIAAKLAGASEIFWEGQHHA